jgi:hypothetical protein
VPGLRFFEVRPSLQASSLVVMGRTAPSCRRREAGLHGSPGFNLGANNLVEYRQLPRTQAAIADGLATEEDIAAAIAARDRNGDGYVCVQLSEGYQKNGPWSVYYYNVTDDNASAPSG